MDQFEKRFLRAPPIATGFQRVSHDGAEICRFHFFGFSTAAADHVDGFLRVGKEAKQVSDRRPEFP